VSAVSSHRHGFRRPSSLALLADEHALDAYLAACALRPDRAILIHARDLLRPARLQQRAIARHLGIEVDLLEMADDTSIEQARRTFASLPPDCHLHHTGGTGAMAEGLLTAFAAAGRPGELGSCLDEERRLLRRDDGLDIPLETLLEPSAVTFEVLTELYGLEVMGTADRHHDEEQLLVDALRDGGALPLPAAGATGDEIRDALVARLEGARPADGRLGRRAAWAPFISGMWLERLAIAGLRRVAPDHELHTGVRLRRGNTRLELDVVAVGDYRPTVISCTVADSGRVAKQKAFEVLRRAQQTGGRVARPALVTLLDHRSLPRADTIAASLADQSRAPNALRVYSSGHVLAWANALATDDDNGLADLRHAVLD
jgi:hypothetical protein